jgi:hypothetical protein
MNDYKRNTVLFSLLSMKHKDEELLEITCKSILKGKAVTN